jgi:hypothetical protein
VSSSAYSPKDRGRQGLDCRLRKMYILSMMVIKETPELPPPEDLRGVLLRTVDDAPAVVFVRHDGERIVVPVPLREVPPARRAA